MVIFFLSNTVGENANVFSFMKMSVLYILYSTIILTLIYRVKGNKNSKSIILAEWLLAFSIIIIIIPYSRRANLLLEGK